MNTFWFENGQLCGDNTDGYGFAAHLSQTFPDWDQEPATVRILGAGGAARGLIAPLLTHHVKMVSIANRSRERAETLARDLTQTLGPVPIEILDWTDRDRIWEWSMSW